MDTAWLRSARGRAWIAAGAPILALLIVVTTLAVSMLAKFARDEDNAFVASSRQLAHGAIEARETALANMALDYANWDEAYRAVTLRWNEGWIASNYYSSVFDALVLFRADGTVRHVWTSDGQPFPADAISQLVADAAQRIPNLTRLPTAPTRQGMVARTATLWQGHPVLIGVAPVTLEDDRARLEAADARPTDYLATVSFLDDSEVSSIGAALTLNGFRFDSRGIVDPHAVQLALSGADNADIGSFSWTNARPGTAAFQSEIGLALAFFLISGAVAIFVTHMLVRRNVVALAQAESALVSSRMKSEFIATMSEELLTPINTIIGFAELIEEEAVEAGNPGTRDDVRNILGAARRLARLAEEVLDQSRIETGRLKLHLEPVFVTDLLAAMQELVRERAEANRNIVRVSIEPGIDSLLADPFRLQQCLLNIVGNALKFTRDGKVEVRARRAQAPTGEFVAIDVIDNGIGLSPQEMERIFAPFSQANATIHKTYGGAGLGLSITRQLARAMGGDVTVTSTPGSGATFTLTLRAVSGQRAAA